MISSWKTRFQSLVADTSADSQPEGASGEESVSHLHQVLADLRRSHGVPDAAVASEPPAEEAVVPDMPELQAAATVEADDAAATDEVFETARQFIDEHRETVESLLQELGALDACVKSHANVTDAFNEYAAAKQRATDAAAEEQRTKKFADASAKRHDASKRERESADGLVDSARAEFQSANDHIVELERQLREAAKLAEGKAEALKECEARAERCAADESAAASEAAKAVEQHAACQSARVAAEQDCQAAKDRAETLKKESGAQSVATISDVQKLALKIAGGAAALNGSAKPA